MHTQQSNVHVPPSTGVNSCTDASGSQPRSILKKHKIPPAKSDSMKKVEEHPRTIRSSLKTTNRVDSSISSKRTVVQIVLGYLVRMFKNHDGGSLKAHEFVKKFIGTVRFGNDHFDLGRLLQKAVLVMFVIRMVLNLLTVPMVNYIHYSLLNYHDEVTPQFACYPKTPSTESWLWHMEFKPLELRAKKHTHKTLKTGNTILEVPKPLHMDLYGPMRVQTIHGKKYILVIVDDYSRFTWVKFFRSKDETPTVVIKFLKQIKAVSPNVDSSAPTMETEFVNKDSCNDYYEALESFTKRQCQGLHSRTALSKDGTELLSRQLGQC
ncbi:retrovirus-related pol polyprotein from transposon TNT 1-94 [Tanacetum coccineum]